MLKIYNHNLNKKLPIEDSNITMYCCGPTVYDNVHIGNIRPLIVFDCLYRFLKYQKINVKYTQNITDVDDKIIKRAKDENTTEQVIAKTYSNAYFDIMKKLNVLTPDNIPFVTDNISGIIDYIATLVDKGFAYVTKTNDVYFSIDKVKKIYGQISNQKISNLLNDVRKENKKNKNNKLDFVLWKTTEDGINWKSQWSEHGRPGWHTECSYFISKYYNDTITIHGGGVDLKFPHHENENAQHYAYYDKPLAKHWMHVGHLNVDGKKMSKSLNNFVTAKDLLDKYSSDHLRWYFMQTHYASPINFSYKTIEQIVSEYEKFIRSINNLICQTYLNTEKKYKFSSSNASDEFIHYMEDDLNLSDVISLMYSQYKEASNSLRQKYYDEVLLKINTIINELNILGFTYDGSLGNDVYTTLKKMATAIKDKNYAISDSLRKELIDKKII